MKNSTDIYKNPLIEKVTSTDENIVFYGEGGAGKSTAMMCLNEYYIDQAKHGKKIIPVFIDVKRLDTDSCPVMEYIFREFCGDDSDRCVLNELLCGKLSYAKEYKIVILVDGYNEADFCLKKDIVDEIGKLKRNKNIRIIISSRVRESDFERNGFKSYLLENLSDERVKMILEIDEINSIFLEILKNPIFLSAFLKTHSQRAISGILKGGGSDTRIHKATILDAYLKKLFKDLEGKKQAQVDVLKFVLDYWLPAVAFEMAKREKYIIADSVLKTLEFPYFKKFFSALQGEKQEQVCYSESFRPVSIGCQDIAVLKEISEKTYAFIHQIWRDYFAAKHIVNTINADLIENLEEIPYDENVYEFVGELLKKKEKCECDYATKKDSNSESSPIEDFLEKHNLKSERPLSAKATANLIEIMKTSRNRKITADYSELDLRQSLFLNCDISASVFENSIISMDCFYSTSHEGCVCFSSFSEEGSFFISIDETETAFIWNLKSRKRYMFDLRNIFLDERLCNEDISAEKRLFVILISKVSCVRKINENDFAVSFNTSNFDRRCIIFCCTEKGVTYSWDVVDNVPDEGITHNPEIEFGESVRINNGFDVIFNEHNVQVFKDNRFLGKIDSNLFSYTWSFVAHKESIALTSDKNVFVFFFENNDLYYNQLLGYNNVKPCGLYKNNLLAFEKNFLYIFDLGTNQLTKKIDLNFDVFQAEIINGEFLLAHVSDEDYVSVKLFKTEDVLNDKFHFIAELPPYYTYLRNVRYQKVFDCFSFSIGGFLFLWNYKANFVAEITAEDILFNMFSSPGKGRSYYSDIETINNKYYILGFDEARNQVFSTKLNMLCGKNTESLWCGVSNQKKGEILMENRIQLTGEWLNISFDPGTKRAYFAEYIEASNRVIIWSFNPCGNADKTLENIIQLNTEHRRIVEKIIANNKEFAPEINIADKTIAFSDTYTKDFQKFDGYILQCNIMKCDFLRSRIIDEENEIEDSFKSLHINGGCVPEAYKPDFQKDKKRLDLFDDFSSEE